MADDSNDWGASGHQVHIYIYICMIILFTDHIIGGSWLSTTAKSEMFNKRVEKRSSNFVSMLHKSELQRNVRKKTRLFRGRASVVLFLC